MTANITYATVEPLVASHEVKGSSVSVNFCCPTTNVEAQASASIKKSDGVGATAERSVKQNFWRSMRRTVMSTVASVFGNGAAGRVARDVSNTAVKNAANSSAFTKGEVQTAIAAAFESVQTKFEWSEESRQWVGAGANASVESEEPTPEVAA